MKSKNLSENILRSVKFKGYKYINLPSVIEANHIVQRSGENFRKFIFSFIDQNGSELCLRPDLTIASCLRYLENNLRGKEKIFYSGQAYRKSQNKKDSIIRNQIGFEIIGSKNEKNDDKEIINTSLKSLQNLKYSTGTLTIGNVEIFNLLISKLDIPKRWKLRLSRHFWREDYFNDLLERLETNSDVDPTIVEVDKKRYLKMLKDDQLKIVAGRSINEILKRFDNKIKDPRRASKGKNVSKIIKDFLKIKCPINQAASELNKFFKRYKINLVVDQKYFPLSQNKVSKLNVIFSTSFGRQLEYYTGMVFKIDIKSNSKIKNVINGGRYDHLISDLGSKKRSSSSRSSVKPMIKDIINIGIPSKGRLRKDVLNIFKKNKLKLISERGERDLFGSIKNKKNIKVVYLHAREIIQRLGDGSLDLGFSGFDLLKESEINIQNKISVNKKYNFGKAILVVAIPDEWIDVQTIADLEEIAFEFKDKKKKRLRVGTKYPNLSREFLFSKGVTQFKLVDSLGATETYPFHWICRNYNGYYFNWRNLKS
jgi:ATP phosphoribosyltransferase regulatory subunit